MQEHEFTISITSSFDIPLCSYNLGIFKLKFSWTYVQIMVLKFFVVTIRVFIVDAEIL